MFGVLFGEDKGSKSLGVLIFKSECKAREVFASMLEKSNMFNNQIFTSWNLKLCAVFSSVDIDDVPEIDVQEIQENTFNYLDFDGHIQRIQLINTNHIACI